jgi:integrase
MAKTWVKRWGYEVSEEPVHPGVYALMNGGFLLRAKATDPRTARTKEAMQVVRDVSLGQAIAARSLLVERVRSEIGSVKQRTPLFCEFAASLMEAKIKTARIRSASGRRKWEEILRSQLFPAFGSLRVDQMTHDDVERWFLAHAALIKKDQLSPRTANTRLAILKVICRAAAARYAFADPTAGIVAFDTTTHPTYTPEEPNSLTTDELPRFLDAIYEHFPQHYAVTFLGFVTGLRPSTLFPLRIVQDVRWQDRQIWIRRSHTHAQEVMNTTKTGVGYPIGLPQDVMDVLRWHIDANVDEGPMRESGLLFPSVRGTIRFTASLQKPFAGAASIAGINKRISAKAMRRTFQDITRAADVSSVVKRSISGHATEAMEGWYSTVAPDEQRAGLVKVVSLREHKAALARVPSPVHR